MDLTLEIEPDVTVNTQQPLNFGTLITNSGRKSINMGDINMGIFSIKALENQEILVTLNNPTSLRHRSPSIDQQIPLNLFARYGYSNNDYSNSKPIIGSINSIEIAETPEYGPWSTIYIFIYGSITVGNVSQGIYTNNLVLNIQYF